MVSEEHYSQIANDLVAKGYELSDNADYILSERDIYAQYLIGRKNGELYRIKTNEIIYIESLAHDVIVHCVGEEYKINERLVHLQEILNPAAFLRISNSMIVAVDAVKGIKPALSQKYNLTMSDGSRVLVTRSYYYIFKEFFGI